MNPLAGLKIDALGTAKSLGFDDVSHYQDWHGLVSDDIAGPVTLSSMTERRCGMPDLIRDHSPEEAAWPKTCLDVTTSHRLRLNVDDDVIERAWEAAIGLWNQSCGIRLTAISQLKQANIWARSRPLPGSTLAWSFLPNGMCNERIEQAYDTTERWNFEMLAKVMLHEIGHALGFEHNNERNSILFPSILSNPLSVYPSPGDVRLAVSMYGPPETVQPPPPGDLAELTLSSLLVAGRYELRAV